eukprot:TRINITY_DN1645_c0_g1_i6.p1 TRINITY_DN1645_c0_g1~~TRINITY_DN1645_c0_g1_i6.p1  ORF type:complete len:1062 (+),score=365.52 TRINITY_DN1645_c0_g1_i6:134-3319(+)
MSEESDRKEVIKLIRACLLSSKGGVCLDQINRDYHDLVGENIPYRKLGHANLTDFFSKARDVCRIMESQGKILVHPVATQDNQHIDLLVSGQKKSSSGSARGKKRGGGQQQQQQHYGFRRPAQRSSWIPPVHSHHNNAHHHHFNGHGKGGNHPRRGAANKKVGSGRLPPRSSISNSTFRMPSQPQSGGGVGLYASSASVSASASASSSSHKQLRAPSSIPHNNNANGSNKNTNGAGGNASSNTYQTTPHATAPVQANGRSPESYPLKIGTFHSGRQSNTKQKGNPTKSNGADEGRDYVKDLSQYLESKGMGPLEFKTSEMGSKKVRARTYVSSVCVEGTSYRTFPLEYGSKELAEAAAAKLAVEALGLKEETAHKPKEEGYKQVGEMNDVIAQRIVEMVGDKMNGVWSTQIDMEYKGKYKEVLPLGWPQSVILERHGLTVSTPIKDYYIVIPQKTGEEEESQDKPIFDSSKKTTLPPLVLPEDPYWYVHILAVHSPEHVVVRFLDDRNFADLSTEMELYYYDFSTKLPPVTEPTVGSLYAAKLDSDWHRVRVRNVMGIRVTVYFIDLGDEETLTVNDLRAMNPKFLSFPPQAISVNLAGLESLEEDAAASHLREIILGRSFVAEVISRGEEDAPRIILYDTSTDNDINLNKQVLEELRGEVSEVLNSRLSPGDEISPAFLLSVSSSASGELILQRGLDSLQSLIQEAKDNLSADEPSSLGNNKLYLAKSALNENTLYRASLLSTQVKEGKAFKARLADVPEGWTPEAAEKLRALIPQDKAISVKVVQSSPDGQLPLVEIRFYLDGGKEEDSSSINALISDMTELFILPETSSPPPTPSSAFSPMDELLFSEIASLKGLVPPKIPEKDEFLDVTVTLAASPSNFYVQPWRQTESLEILVSEINEYYSEPSRRVHSITLDDLKKDSFFAALHSDGYWYRIKVDQVLEDQNLTVKIVDYGDFIMVPLTNLQPLWPQFRNLPMQAIKAFLSEIVPVNGDWTPDDAVWFSNRSVNKQFVSVVKDASQEEDGSIKLGLSLIDVSHPKEDIIIDKLLVEEKRAVYLCI